MFCTLFVIRNPLRMIPVTESADMHAFAVAGVCRLSSKQSQWTASKEAIPLAQFLCSGDSNKPIVGKRMSLKGAHTPPRLKPTANCLYPTTPLPLV